MKAIKKFTPIALILITVGFSKPSLSENVAIHSILDIKGAVKVQKKQWKTAQPANVGLFLQSEDKLFIPANASVKIYCSDLTTREAKPSNHLVSEVCHKGEGVVKLPGSNNGKLRDPSNTQEILAKLPYLITPRDGYILTNTPKLRWNKVSGANFYTIHIYRVDWVQKTNNTEITYTGELPLQTDIRYHVTIETDNDASEKNVTLGFTILDESTKKEVLNAVEKIKQQPLSSEQKVIILAQLYRGYKLYQDAIAILEDSVTQGNQNEIVYELLGKTYLETGLPQLAKQPYEKALQLANNTENLSLQADIQRGLGETYGNLGQREKAVQLLQKAKNNYAKLGDEVLVQELDKIINSISES